MSLRCERPGADVTGIDGIFRDGLRAQYGGGSTVSPFLYAGEQVEA